MGGKGGGGGISIPNMGNIKVEPSEYENRLAAIANQMYTLTGPLRQYSLEDLGTFMRGPGGATPWITGASPVGMGSGTTATGTSGYTGTTSAPMSSNFTAPPSYNDIYGALKTAYTGGDVNAFNNAASYLAQFGEGIGGQMHQPLFMSNDPTGAMIVNPEFDPWLKSEAQRIFNAQISKGMQTIATNQQTAQQPVSATTTASSQGASYGGSGRYDPYQLPAYAPLYQLARTGLESQYNPARENIMASTPRGGALYSNLANLEMSRAQQAGSLPATIAAPIISDLYNKAYGVAWNTPQTSISGLGTAEQGLASRYGSLLGSQTSANNAALAASLQQAQMNQQSGMAGAAGLGSLAGMGIKAAMK